MQNLAKYCSEVLVFLCQKSSAVRHQMLHQYFEYHKVSMRMGGYVLLYDIFEGYKILSLVLDSARVKDTMGHTPMPVYSVSTVLLCFLEGHASFLWIHKTWPNHLRLLSWQRVLVSAVLSLPDSSLWASSFQQMPSIRFWSFSHAASSCFFCVTDRGESSTLMTWPFTQSPDVWQANVFVLRYWLPSCKYTSNFTNP